MLQFPLDESNKRIFTSNLLKDRLLCLDLARLETLEIVGLGGHLAAQPLQAAVLQLARPLKTGHLGNDAAVAHLLAEVFQLVLDEMGLELIYEIAYHKHNASIYKSTFVYVCLSVFI